MQRKMVAGSLIPAGYHLMRCVSCGGMTLIGFVLNRLSIMIVVMLSMSTVRKGLLLQLCLGYRCGGGVAFDGERDSDQ